MTDGRNLTVTVTSGFYETWYWRYLGEQDKTFYGVYSIFDSDLKKAKELYRMKWIRQPGQKRKLFETCWYSPYDNKIFIAREGFIIDVFDAKGERLFSINQKYRNLLLKRTHLNIILT